MSVQAAAPEVPAGWLVATSVSVAADGSVWAINSGTIVHASAQLQPWTTLAGAQASCLTVSPEANMLCAITAHGIEYLPASGSGAWRQLPPLPVRPASLAIESGSQLAQSAVWAVDVRRGVWSWSVGGREPWQAAHVTADVLAATSDGSLYRLDGGALYQLLSGTQWESIATPEPFADVSAGATGWLWGVGRSGSVYQFDGSAGWETIAPPVQGPGATIAAGEDTTVWLLAGGGIYQYDAEGADWSPIGWEASAAPRQLAVGNLETIWALDDAGGYHRYTQHADTWEQLGVSGLPQFAQVSAVSAQELWALDETGGIATLRESGGGWQFTPMPGGGWSAVSAGGDAAWALDGNGHAYVWGGSDWKLVSNVPVRAISVAGEDVAAIDAGGRVLTWDYAGFGWAPVTPAAPEAAIDVSIQPGGAIWAVTAAHQLQLFLGRWIALPGYALTQVSGGVGGAVWGVEVEGDLVDLSGAGPFAGATVPPPHALPQWDTESPFDEAQSTHLWIVNRAAELAQGQGSLGRQICALVQPHQPHLGVPFHDNLCQGLYDADFRPEYNNPVFGQATYASHFYDPDTGLNWLWESAPTALTQGRAYFNLAVARYRAGDMAGAGYALGLSLHYLTDLTQPMHAANFTYLSSKPRWGYHTAFEAYVMEIQSSIATPATYRPSPLTRPEEFLIAAARNAKSKYYDAICPYWCFLSYSGFTSYYKAIAKANAPAVLGDAITFASQYLVAWMAAATA